MLRRREDLGLGRRREADHLRVAPAFDVEDAGVAPAVLVVADQRTFRVGGERRLARAREAEEDGDTPVVGDVRRAVHREDAFERQAVVHDGEDRLLDLARVERAADEELGSPRMEHDERTGARAVVRRDGLEVGRVQDEGGRLKGCGLVGRQLDEHRLREECVVRVRCDDAHADPVRRIGSGPRIDHVERIGKGEVGRDLLT